jgi:flagellar motor switch protein FliG
MGEMTGRRKAAVLLLQMDRELSAQVLSSLRESEVEEITAEIARIGGVEADIVDGVVDEVRTQSEARQHTSMGGPEFARELLEASLGEDRAAEIVDRLAASMREIPFQFLYQVDPAQVISVLHQEHPQLIALVLAHVVPEYAVAILAGLTAEQQADAAHRIGVMDRASPEVVEMVEDVLRRALSGALGQRELSTVGGLDPLVEIINKADRTTEKMILQGLEGKDKSLAEQVRSRLFLFEDIVMLDDKAIQLLARQVETADLAAALKGVRDEVRDKVIKNMSQGAAETLLEEIELLGPVRLRAVEEARTKIVHVIRTLEESGEIVINRSSDDEYVS